MKCKYTALLPLALSAAMLLTACAPGQAAGAEDDGSTVELSQRVGSLDLPATDSAANPTDTTDSTGGADAGNDAGGASDLYASSFSSRDLSGEYDAAEAVAIELTGTGARADSAAVTVSGSDVTITAAGVYLFSGSLDNGSVIVNAGKEDKVQLVLNGVSIHSDSFAAIYVAQADKVFVTLADGTVNSLSGGAAFTPIDGNDVDAVIYAKDDLTLNGTGTLKISSPAGHGISGKDEVTITGGTYEIAAASHAIRAKDSLAIADGSFTLAAGKDGLHAENSDDDTLGNLYIAGGSFAIQSQDDAIHANTLLQIDGGDYDVTAAEGLEATYIRVNGGTFHIAASDDGVNAARKSTAYTPTVEINGGELTIEMGAGDTDGIDSNGNLIINGGTIDITGRSSFDYDGSGQYNGGTIIVNGQQLTSLPNQMMGGRGMMGGNMQPGGGRGRMTQDGGSPWGGVPGDGAAPRMPEDGAAPGDGMMRGHGGMMGGRRGGGTDAATGATPDGE